MGKRAVLIGKGRRIVIDELIALVHGSAELDLYGETAQIVEEAGFAYDGPTTLIVSSDGNKLSSAGSIASASILCLAVAQGRLIFSKKESAIATSALIGVVRLLQSDASLQLPADAGEYLACLNASLEGSGVCTFPTSLTGVVERIVNLAISAVVAGQTRSLCQVVDVIAALSAERLAVDVSAYADTYYDALRPHRESSTSATTMRAILNGSQMAKLGKQGLRFSNEAEPAKAVLNAPQQLGPAREAVKAACKTLELEMNCSEPDGQSLFDETVVRIATLSVAGAIASLLEGTCARRSTSNDVDGSLTTDAQSQSLSTICSMCEHNYVQLKSSLEAEADSGIEFVRVETKRAEEEAKTKEAMKAAKASSVNPKESANGGGEKDEFAGMSEEKKSKDFEKTCRKGSQGQS
uniref:Uncharacterized protein n=1 Tax=Leptocylindrus danicus TaxID=163516 RepID=A0A7S2NY33_9STRA